MLPDPPMIGRKKELSRLELALNETKHGAGMLVLVSGVAGVGKTRLVMEFENEVLASGCKMLFGGCLPSARIPYLPFLEAVNGLFDEQPDKHAINRTSRLLSSTKKAAPDMLLAVPVLGPILKGSAIFVNKYRGTATEDEVDEHILFATIELFRTESAKQPLVIFLDDLQWADNSTVGMLHFLAREVRNLPIMLLGTYRPEDIMIDKKQGGNPFLDSLRVMKREGLCEDIAIGPLNASEVGQVISAMLQQPVDGAVLERIFKESGGRPLFAVETVRMLESRGDLAMRDGIWRIVGASESDIPSSVKEVQIRRVERMTKEDRRILEYASVIGHTFNIDLLAELLKVERLDLMETLERFQNDHQLVREVDGLYEFQDEDLRRVVYESISNLRRKELHRMIDLSMKRQPGDCSN